MNSVSCCLRACRAAFKGRAGVTLTELMVALTVLTVGVIGSMGAFKYINKAMTQSRMKTIATNLAQEKMEVLRNKPYFQLLVTTAPAVTSGYSPNFSYDTGNYPPQVITLWGMPALTRMVNVDYITLSGSVATPLSYNDNDPGMKRITVSVIWRDGDAPKKVQIDSYYENPTAAVLSAGFNGTVTNISGGAAVPDALVQVIGAPKWRGYSNAATGAYSFQVAPGTYTLVCSTQGYFSETSAQFYVGAGSYVTKHFSLYKMGTGSFSGSAYLRNHLVISQVVGSSVNNSGNYQEWVEVYNPTTWTWTMAGGLGTGGDTGSNAVVAINFKEEGEVEIFPRINYRTLDLAPDKYFLFANTGTVTAAGVTRAADAVYGDDWDFSDMDDVITTGSPSAAGRLILGNALTMTEYDVLGWNATSNGNLTKKTASRYEGVAIAQATGFEPGEGYTRETAAGAVTSGQGRCYDSHNNNNDFNVSNPVAHAPRNTSVSEPCLTGTPAAGAVVDANDGLSSPTLVAADGSFLLTGVATGAVHNAPSTWEVLATSYTVINSSAGLTLAPAQSKNIGTIVLSTAIEGGIAMGYVYGSGPAHNVRLPSIKVGNGATVVTTNSQGFYRLFLGTGTVVITANFAQENGSYQTSDAEVTVLEGAVTNVPDFHLAQGGIISGYVTSGTGALPNVVVQATNGGPVYEDTSDSTGHYYISAATSAISYTVTPVLDALQSYTSLPANPLTAVLSAPGTDVFAGTITVVGALGTITGTVIASSASITTGVLVVASTVAVSNPLPAITAVSAPAGAVVYSVSSQADGTYTLDVRSSTSTAYYMRAFYPVVNAHTGAVDYTTREFSSVWVSTAGATVTRNFTW